ncbi:hypothetical protein DFR52_102504 [Hoeflea marina]|uniref:(S)-ureidoglycine aminohydrolase cupin domain-containing protein n=1 Tax=Hoeflea marina TaxID=274592 RepID=A0A317PQH9_9HYPH|nr:cupin domain-containing protein [Hoeflea marina]PWW01840.1 hypothetical protein DFR52_102504 [Hoeflea marina]
MATNFRHNVIHAELTGDGMAIQNFIPTIMAMAAVFAVPRVGRDFIAGHPGDIELAERPIDPDWIVSGEPRARAARHSVSTDGRAATQVWDCTAGSFHWTFYEEETVYILEGSVRVTTEDGNVRLLGVGDMAYFAPRSRALWEIDDYVKKIAFCRTTGNPTVTLLRGMLGRMRRAIRN